MPTINHLSGKPLRPITAPAQTGFYEAREFDLCATLRLRVARLGPDADIQPLVLEAASSPHEFDEDELQHRRLRLPRRTLMGAIEFTATELSSAFGDDQVTIRD